MVNSWVWVGEHFGSLLNIIALAYMPLIDSCGRDGQRMWCVCVCEGGGACNKRSGVAVMWHVSIVNA